MPCAGFIIGRQAVPIEFQNFFYAHLILLHLSLLLRIGDLAKLSSARMWGVLLNGSAIVLFLANNVRAVGIGHKTAYSQEVDNGSRKRVSKKTSLVLFQKPDERDSDILLAR